jgi:hypothetical protein
MVSVFVTVFFFSARRPRTTIHHSASQQKQGNSAIRRTLVRAI